MEIAKAGGLRAVVLEARARIGGRLLTSLPDGLPCPPGPFDLGGAWLTGLDGNPLVPLCDELGVRMRSAGRAPQESDVVEAPSDAFYISTGERISQEDIDKAEDGLPRLYTRIRSEFSAPDRSLADAIALLRAKAEKEGDPIDKFTFHLLESNTELNEGASTREASNQVFTR